ncbi:GntR family transcriptional regulator [Pseudophaeobacter sp.]|jgi:DNA-binding GntR family transcriptional regulator|uniref:HTH gntR-type domain-containing protein n=2 Tax=Pseudophaeobacter arcticus TaxID=385492 RepID=A0ABQ0AH38_9RHOB|nr:GntR family transcriptional regulator [Pseudophaeobacter sp.]
MNKLVKALEAAEGVQDRLSIMYDTLRHRICTLHYPPGMRLSETDLAKEFACSRTPLRRVLAWLEREELITSRQGVGTFVTTLNAASLAQNFVVRATLERAIVEIDPTTELDAASLRFEALNERCAELKEKPNVVGFAQLDMEAFDAFVEITENAALRDSGKSYYGRTTRHQLHSLAKDTEWCSAACENLDAHVTNIHSALAVQNLEAAAHYQIAYTRMLAP